MSLLQWSAEEAVFGIYLSYISEVSIQLKKIALKDTTKIGDWGIQIKKFGLGINKSLQGTALLSLVSGAITAAVEVNRFANTKSDSISM